MISILAIKHLILKSDRHLKSLNSITLSWNINIMRMKEVITHSRSFGLLAKFSDQYQYLGNCPPTPPLTQQQSIDDKLRLMLG